MAWQQQGLATAFLAAMLERSEEGLSGRGTLDDSGILIDLG